MEKNNAETGPALTFGRNWLDYLDEADAEQYAQARESLENLVGSEKLNGAVFFDLGCGSGIFSLAAASLGAATVMSLDRDPDSVAACRMLQEKSDHPNWRVLQGSVLDKGFLDGLGQAQVVYSWGVLHHTGSMWEAIENACGLVAPGGMFAMAIYNRTSTSLFWLRYKEIYHKAPAWLRKLMVWGVFLPRAAVRALRGKNPLRENRGMSIYLDAVDWCLGLPYEYATFAEIRTFVEKLGFKLLKGVTTGGTGCNEFVFQKEPA